MNKEKLTSRKFILSIMNFVATTGLVFFLSWLFFQSHDMSKIIALLTIYVAFLGLNSGLYNWFNAKSKLLWTNKQENDSTDSKPH